VTTDSKTTTKYEVVEGDYDGTTDDRRGRWYIQRVGGMADRRGAGYSTRAEALDMLALCGMSVAYAVAFVARGTGEWDRVHEFEAESLDEANETADEWVAAHHPGRIADWHLLDAAGQNVNG